VTYLKGSSPIGSQQSRQELPRTFYPQVFVRGDKDVKAKGPGQESHQKQKATDGDILFDDGLIFVKHWEVV
jgi:hypothetical protein